MRQLGRYDQPIVSHKSLSGRPDPLLAIGGQRELGGTGMTSVERPFRLAMADDEDAWGRHGLRPF